MGFGNAPQSPCAQVLYQTAPATMNEMYEQCKKSPDLSPRSGLF